MKSLKINVMVLEKHVNFFVLIGGVIFLFAIGCSKEDEGPYRFNARQLGYLLVKDSVKTWSLVARKVNGTNEIEACEKDNVLTIASFKKNDSTVFKLEGGEEKCAMETENLLYLGQWFIYDSLSRDAIDSIGIIINKQTNVKRIKRITGKRLILETVMGSDRVEEEYRAISN